MTPVGEQAAARYTTIGERLDAAGLGFGDVARISEFVSLECLGDYPEVAQARSEAIGVARPPVVTTVVEALWEAGAGIRIDVEVDGVPGLLPAPDGAVYLPTILPVDGTGEVVAPGDFRAQYRWCLERAAGLLTEMGLGPEHLVQTIDFSTAATRDVYSMCGRPRREILGPVFPGAAGILVSSLPHPDVLVGFELTASTFLPTAVNPGWARYETLTYNPAVRAGNVLYGSGFAALDPVTQQAVHSDDPAEAVRYTYRSILAVLAAAGAGPEQLSRVLEYVCPSGVPVIDVLAEARREVLGGVEPALTTVGCATLLRPEFVVEVVPTAILEPGPLA